MNCREKFSVGLLCIGLILSFLPLTGNKTFIARPKQLLTDLLDKNSYVTVDQLASLIVNEDSSIQIIDLRSEGEYRKLNIPGSVNINYPEFLDNGSNILLPDNGKTKNIFYANGDIVANYALTISRGLNIKNTYVLKGGLNEWFNTIMNNCFTGDRISARENAIYETRTRAKKIFSELNSLPDSLKFMFNASRHSASKKLEGGCE